jgi:hypothetical protein
LLLANDTRNIGGRHANHWGVPVHLDLLGDLAELQRHVDTGLLTDDQMNPAAHLFLEAPFRDVHFVFTHGERRHPVVARIVGNRAACLPSFHICCPNGRAGHCRSCWIGHSARNSSRDLCPSRRGAQQDNRQAACEENEQIPWNGTAGRMISGIADN